jgi:hypothetical protein
MKTTEDLFFTVTKILSTARNFEQLPFFFNCSKMKCGTRTAYFCLSGSWCFLCRADDIFEKSVEQSRFEQLQFEQLTLTLLNPLLFIPVVFFRLLEKYPGQPSKLNSPSRLRACKKKWQKWFFLYLKTSQWMTEWTNDYDVCRYACFN